MSEKKGDQNVQGEQEGGTTDSTGKRFLSSGVLEEEKGGVAGEM